MNVFINSININGEDGVFEGKVSINIKNKQQLNALMESMKKVDGVQKVERVNTL